MIGEILDEIRIEEEKAEEIIKKAAEDARQTVLAADETCRKIRLETVKLVKEERRKVIESAEKEGNDIYEKILSESRIEAENKIKQTDIAKAVEFIKEKALTEYGDR